MDDYLNISMFIHILRTLSVDDVNQFWNKNKSKYTCLNINYDFFLIYFLLFICWCTNVVLQVLVYQHQYL